MRVVNTEEMKKIEKVTMEEMGFNEGLILENVGSSGAEFIENNFLQEYDPGEIIILVGKGNNGSDGLAIGRHLANKGRSVRAFLLFGPEEYGDELNRQLKFARHFGVKVNEVRDADELESYFTQTQEQFLVIDAILGLGFRPPLSNYLFDVVNIVNRYASLLIAVDVPTGISGDNGAMSGNAMMADFTMAVGLPKVCHYVGDGATHTGQLVVLDGGFPLNQTAGGDKFVLNSYDVASELKTRDKFAHKNTFGHCLIVGGSQGLTGAVLMSSMAALKAGTGLVTASTWEESYPEMCTRIIPEIMTGLIPTEKEDVDEIIRELKRWDSVVIGPGLGRGPRARETVLRLLNHFAGPVVVDADAIRVLNIDEDAQVLAQRKWPTLLTPHMGEFADFAQTEKEKVLENPMEYLKTMVDRTNSCILMKGACSYLGLPNGEIYINYFPNDGMASGGSGDVLAGILGGLLAQSPMEVKSSSMFADKEVVYSAIKLGLTAHTLAGKHAVEKEGARSMTAGSLIEHLGSAFKELEEMESGLNL
jgi:NAD(P)H-hydrate epimerase